MDNNSIVDAVSRALASRRGITIGAIAFALKEGTVFAGRRHHKNGKPKSPRCRGVGHPCVGKGNVCCPDLVCGPAPNPGADKRCCVPNGDTAEKDGDCCSGYRNAEGKCTEQPSCTPDCSGKCAGQDNGCGDPCEDPCKPGEDCDQGVCTPISVCPADECTTDGDCVVETYANDAPQPCYCKLPKPVTCSTENCNTGAYVDECGEGCSCVASVQVYQASYGAYDGACESNPVKGTCEEKKDY